MRFYKVIVEIPNDTVTITVRADTLAEAIVNCRMEVMAGRDAKIAAELDMTEYWLVRYYQGDGECAGSARYSTENAAREAYNRTPVSNDVKQVMLLRSNPPRLGNGVCVECRRV